MLVEEHGLSIVRACQVARCSRTAWYRPPVDRTTQDEPVREALRALVEENSRWGFWLCYDRLRALGHPWNWKRVYRAYCALRFNLTRRGKKRVLTRPRVPLEAPALLNHTWALDFMGDTLYDGRCYRTLNMLDEGNREGLAIEIDTSLPSVRVVQVLDQLVALHGAPARLRSDNGPEFLAAALADWCAEHGITLQHIQPGKPNQNAFIERFNKTYRTEVLDAWVFTSLAEVHHVTDDWLERCNSERPHQSLGRMPPRTYLPRIKAA